MDNKAQQLAQMLGQGGGQSTMLDWLKSFITPNSTAGTLANQDAYTAYAAEEMAKGNEPLPRLEWLKQTGGNQ